jgi:HipA-like protein
MASLTVWMNGERVGDWTTLRTGTPLFRYEASWTQRTRIIPIPPHHSGSGSPG